MPNRNDLLPRYLVVIGDLAVVLAVTSVVAYWMWRLALIQKVLIRPKDDWLHGRSIMPRHGEGVSHISRGNESKHVALRNVLHCRVAPVCCLTYAFRNSG